MAAIADREGKAGMAAYSATRAGLMGLVKSLAKDHAQSGATVNALAPVVHPHAAGRCRARGDYEVHDSQKIPGAIVVNLPNLRP
jgi:NAD(P)-dependent dehydrogenase (short-subunit alcohol dehydrogenase family)